MIEPRGGSLPGEETLATYRGGELTLTDRRVVFRGRGRHRESLTLRLADVTAAGLMRRFRVQTPYLAVPATIVLGGFALALITGIYEFAFGGFAYSLPTLPLLLLGRGLALRIATPGFRLDVHVPRARRADAEAFATAVIGARFAKDEREDIVLAPTTESFSH